MNVARAADGIIRAAFYLLFALVPLLLTPWNYELFEYNKMMAVYAIAIVVGAAWMVKMIHEKEVRIAKTPLDIPICLFVFSQLLSTVFSMDPHVSWLGYYSRFNGGMWSVFSYVLLYYAAATNLTRIRPFLTVGLTTAMVVASYGVLERLGIDKHLWVQDVQNRVFSTLGQPNWLAAYLVALSPVAWAFSMRSKKWSAGSTLWVVCSVLFFLALLFTRSRSGLLAFVIADILCWGLWFLRSQDKSSLRLPFSVLHLTFALIIFFNGTNIPAVDSIITFRGIRTGIFHTAPPPAEATPSAQVAPALESGGTESGVIRQYVWQGAVNAWRSNTKTMLIGTGTETFAFAFYQYRPAEHNMTSEWDYLYNKAHNEYLNYLATTGALGLGSYLAVLAAFVWWFIKAKPDPLVVALFSGWVSILITNFFGFSVVITQCMLFLFPAFALLHAQKELRMRTRALTLPDWVLGIPLVVGVYFLFRVGVFWYADTLFAEGYRLTRTGNAGLALTRLTQAAQLNAREPLYHDELASLYATIAQAAAVNKDATSAAQFLQQSLAQHDMALAISPANVNFWKTRTRIYVTLSDIDPEFTQSAVDALTHSLSLSPKDPKILYNLAVLYGRLGDGDKAIDSLTKAIELKPNYRDAYFALWVFYSELGQQQQARQILTRYLTDIDPHDKDFQERVQ